MCVTYKYNEITCVRWKKKEENKEEEEKEEEEKEEEEEEEEEEASTKQSPCIALDLSATGISSRPFGTGTFQR